MDRDSTEALVAQVREATARGTPLRIVGGDTKRFYGRAVTGVPLETRGHSGIVSHDPAELVLTARGGTPLAEVEAQLASKGQRLPFEPPHFGAEATIGGAVACGLAGPARAWAGALRDYVLGVRVLTGDGRVLRFGGEVMKNVAGYDVARLMAGSLGILGVLLDVSLKVLPRPAAERTLALEVDQAGALDRFAALGRSALPLSAGSWVDGRLYLRFEGCDATLESVERRVGGEADHRRGRVLDQPARTDAPVLRRRAATVALHRAVTRSASASRWRTADGMEWPAALVPLRARHAALRGGRGSWRARDVLPASAGRC